MGGGDACKRRYWGLRWSSLWIHEAREGCTGMRDGDACERRHWGLRCTSLRGHETCEGVCRIGCGR
eukprot:3594255-Pyramimonas_sp.AAC.1